jgi:hypothetical protein
MERLKYIIGIALVITMAVLAWWHFTPTSAPVGQATLARVAPQVIAVPTQTIKPPSVKVYAPVAKKRLELPDQIQNDPNQYVLTASRLPSDTHPQTVTTVINRETGDVQTFFRREPYPLLKAEQAGHIRLGYGYKTDVGQVYRISASENFWQTKAIHWGIDGTLDSKGQGRAYVGGHVEYQW